MYVTKKDGRLELLDKNKILQRLQSLSTNLSTPYLSLPTLATSILHGTYPNLPTREIDTLASETAASMSTQHPDYGRLAARICASANHKSTPDSFSKAMLLLNEEGGGFVNNEIADLVKRRGKEIDDRIKHERDFEMTYFGYKTLERSYLLKLNEDTIVERIQYLWMRVALGIHCYANLQAAFETYDLMSRGYFTHASPTLFHAGTTHPQLSSCFLVQMSDDSINGIYDTLKRCAVISKAAGGIGLCVHKIRARGTFIKGTRGVSNGLVPMLRVFDVTSHYVDQGGGKRPGAFAIYLEPWHADIFDVLNLKKNHGKEEQRARNLFYGLWVPDLFMKRVEEDGVWSLMCPHRCPGLSECHGEKFEELYAKYESDGRYTRQVRARELWAAILEAQIETGTPYLLYKDAANKKSNQQNLGTIQCSNLCTEIIQYTNEEEVAVCNLASICLPKFVVSDRGNFGSTEGSGAYFDHEQLHKVAKIVTKNLDKVIDVNQYPIEGAKKSNRSHRPVGIGVSGLADTFLRLGLPFASEEAKTLNEAIFETIYHASLEASNEIAREKGSYETFAGSPASEGKLQFNLWGVDDVETPSHRKDQSALAFQKYSTQVNGGGYDWETLRQNIIEGGLRNSLLVAPMPTASTSQILGVNECFEPFASNLYVRRVKAGEFIIVNPHLIQDLTDLGLWNQSVRNQLMRDGGSVAKIECVPDRLKGLYKTVWEMKMKDVIDMAADRGKFIDQSQSLNLFIADPTVDKLTAMHFYAWKKGLKTGIYYLRTRPAVNAIQYTVEKDALPEVDASPQQNIPTLDDSETCLSCSA
ncbi:ribonucleoside reductase [Thalassiosira pseudonana CCMP1335]|uniref:Ribonucleoside-diphosphate reductase n=1 Tax=Thalassiosira pseudonana TaxID=35128 RepID=B8C1L6_THAPS|nr:ribonucleoside reductase [Thalassiosira pseudonana CCMP1335]EED92236.1 ribonucleoside reductase [Thalassiosira pseudonana CCMP1335]